MRNIRINVPGSFWRDVIRTSIFIICMYAGHSYAGVSDTIRPITKRQLLKDTIIGRNPVDLFDLVKIMIGIKKAHLHKKDMNSNGPFYNIYPYVGYTQATGWIGAATANINFRPHKNISGDQSYVNNNIEYTQFNQTIIVSISTFYTNNGKWQFPGDIRYFKFPTTTYGIGSSTLVSDADNIDFSHFRVYRAALRKVAAYTYVGLGYNLDYRWNITDYGAQRGIVDDFVKYGYTRTSASTGPFANFLFDSRDNVNQTITGLYVNLEFNAHLKSLGSNSNWNSLLLDVRKFIPLTKNWYTELGIWGYVWLTLDGHPPYLDLPSVGWDTYNNTGREYPIGRYTGLDMLYLETEFRFNILRNGLVGGVVFGNLETFTEMNGHFFGPIQPGGGAGIRVKFNKNTQSNGCLDYGFGSHHSGGFAGNVNEFF